MLHRHSDYQQLEIKGRLTTYKLIYRHETASDWTYIARESIEEEGILIKEWDVGILEPGNYYIKVKAETDNGFVGEDIKLVTLTDINLEPVFDPYATSYTYESGHTYTINFTATDPEGDSLVYGATNLPEGSTFSSEGVFAWTPSAEGIYSFQPYVSDGENTVIGETVGIIVEISNEPPAMVYLANLRNRIMRWRGYDQEDGKDISYLYRVDDGDWIATNERGIRIRKLNLSVGKHTFAIKARDSRGAESAILAKTIDIKKDKKKYEKKKKWIKAKKCLRKKIAELIRERKKKALFINVRMKRGRMPNLSKFLR